MERWAVGFGHEMVGVHGVVNLIGPETLQNGLDAEGIIDTLTTTLSESPLLVAAIVIGLFVLVVGIRWLIGSLRSTRGDRFRAVLAGYDQLVVLMHPNPDPDAMSCALAVSTLARSVGVDTTIQYTGQISHQENRAFETVLEGQFDGIDTAGELACDDIVLVDHNEARGFPGADGVDPVAVIDHHPGNGTGSEYTDVRTEYGACATIFAEYFESLGWEPTADSDATNAVVDGTNGGTIVDFGNDNGGTSATSNGRTPANSDGGTTANGKESAGQNDDGGTGENADGRGGTSQGIGEEATLSAAVATGLLYGIQTDTNHLTKGCSPAEFHAAEYLYSGIDDDRLDRIANPSVDAEVLDVKARAITSRTVRNAFAVSDVGTVSNPDAISQAADELLNLEGITAVVVLGDTDGSLHLSGRSRDDRVHMGNVLESLVGDIPMASGGGHARMGGAQLSIDHMEGIGPSEGVSREEFRERLFDAMSGDV